LGEGGLSLIEVMVALLISTIGLFGTLALLGTLLKGGDFSRRLTEASVLAQYKLEELVSLPVSVTPPVPPDAAGCPTIALPNQTPTIAQMTPDPLNPLNSLGKNATAGQPTFLRYFYWCTAPLDQTRRVLTVVVQWIDTNTAATHQVIARRERTP
jgi:hypothetical protein